MTFLFAWRYFKAKKSTNAINIIAWISIVAIVVGTASLILVLSVFNGLEDLVKTLYSSFYPDLKISASSGKQIVLTEAQLRELRSVKGVRILSLVVEEKAMLLNGESKVNAYLKGVDSFYNEVSGIRNYMVKGSFDLGDSMVPKLVLGAGIENAVGIQSDRSIYPLLIYTGRKGSIDLQNPLNNVNSAEAATSGAFIVQQEFDNKYAISNIHFVRQLLEMEPDQYTAAEIKIAGDADVEDLKAQLEKTLGKAYLVQDRYQQNQSLYSVMRAEKWIIYAILSLILVVAAFNMVGALTMLVLEKKGDISVLHALGGSKTLIQKIFLSEGILLAGIGGGVGMLLALMMALAQIKYKLIPLQGGSFLIDYFPVKLNGADFLLVSATVMVIAVIASWIPARKAAQEQFGLRSE
ncbi:MAG TPA: FtsX-like permease family protein [Flavisolibacter sp.]